ncbi:SMU1112c/YaeR family gloxylase I-like metalloprotein [Guptibacillus hwajinpoensis]|uniref:SMU1112c/YaeR family gloxylase I-like metalloprotein n=1 Tax=Guptibacillus hwajinpoensis TaxID=208199 RepID=UPI001CFD10A3|nr:VOC family protein [Pseudalkalibacillus hwajinpoensis]WLR61619.1 VOC family protein [Pseudalkalibacillus hwajinpoensis]
MFTKVHHVAIICGDYEKSKKFYVDTLGLKVIEETYREERNSYKLDLAVGEHTRIELFSFSNAPERPSYPEAKGLRHIAFEVLDLDKAVNHLTERGVSSIEDVRVDELTMKRFTFFSDPDGLPIELYEK